MFMRPQQQREAEEMLTLAKQLVEARGDEIGIYWLTDSLYIASDVPLLGKSDEANTLTITIRDSTVLHAVYGYDGSPPFFVQFKPDSGWKWTIRRAHAALEMEKHYTDVGLKSRTPNGLKLN